MGRGIVGIGEVLSGFLFFVFCAHVPDEAINTMKMAASTRAPQREFSRVIGVFHIDILPASVFLIFISPNASENITKGKPSEARPWSMCSIESAAIRRSFRTNSKTDTAKV